ncbi:hypothetical protein KPL71_026434 [Citrus sinensis]|uniref:Uncharacterized protein n=1 Tax=Citrus sinensis TaxID=2711 RepID=A0ACB8HZD8_CITSI|nr:hypothetical protein KPL71_026434 [Citrus sinensis]
MASTSSSTPVTLSSTLSLPKSCTSHTANKIENLVEYSYIPESAQISESSYPLISPYHLYKRPSSFTRSIRTLISTRRPHPKEYIQSSRLDQCSLQATPAEQYVTLEIPSELISNWKREGYTHLHLGGIRLILTLHGRKGLPVTARLAMLDTRFKQYQDAVIGTVLTTLHAGSVLLTFYPNFNLSLQDPNLPTTLKVQIQIQGAEQISSAKIATLHHQLVYRLQNHALDLPTPEHHSDTLMVLAESDQIPTIIQIPRQIPRHELIKLMPLEWISNYEQFHNNTAPIQTSESMFERRQDGTVRMTFKPPPSAPQEPPRLSFTYSSMITAVQTAQEDLPITGFNSEGYPVYPAKHNGHFLWDAPGSGMCDPNCPCWDDWEEDDDYATTRKKKPKKKKPPVPCHHCDPKPPSDPPPPPAPLPIYRKELKWIAKHCKSEIPSPLSHSTPIVQPLACMMFSSTSSEYSSSFPSLEPHTDPQRNVVSKPFIPSPITSTGHLEPPKPFESVLNWQTQNARAQNDTLLHLNSRVENISLRTEQIETKVDSITAQMQQIYQNLQSRISQLDSELRAMLAHRYSGPEFDQKEREIRRLKAELAQIESERQRPTLFTTSPPIPSIGPTYHPFASMLSPIKQYDPSKLFGMTHTLFRDNPLPPPPKPKPKPRPQPRPAPLHPSSLTIPGQPSPSSTPASPLAPLFVPTQSKDKEPMHQFTAHTVTHSSTTVDQTSDSNPAVSDSPTETDTESSVSTSDSEKSYADITKILMAQPDQPTQGQTSHTEPYVDIPSEVEEEMPESSATNQSPPTQTNPSSQKSSNGPWFTFDDLPSHKWRDRLNEMSAWIDLQMLRPGATTQSVLREFATRFTGALRDWFDSLGQYRQLQFVDLPEVSSALAVLHDQFLGDPSAVFEAARRDYLNMKCCSLNAKDLDFHYKRMSLLFYKLNGFNEPTLKHVFLASLPEELQPNIQTQLTASNLSLDNISLGKIFQLAKTCLDKLCEQKQFFKELLKDKEPFRSACKKPYLQIKCHKKKDCDCSSKKKRHFRKFKPPEFSSKPRRSRKPYRFFRKKSSSSREFKRKQSSRCFICKRKGHYAKDCPNKREKSIRLVEHLQATTDYSPAKDELEFYFSEQDEPNDETVFALQNSSDSDSDQSQVIFHQQSLSLDTTVPIPSIKLQILPSKFQRPIPAIGLIDTGAQRSMLNPHILPSEYWTQSEEHFKAVNGKLFTTSLITKKPVGIQIFPNCVIWTKVIGSTLPNKDILLGFDVLHQIKHLQIIPTGIRVKSMFKPFTDILKLYNLSETPQSYQDISTKLLSFCPESHSEFTHPNPLWKNKSFFIKLPFKLNEDINPTKATHPGMSPSDLLLAQQECSQLLAQGLIEPTSSQWACQAFYVEKHSEIVRGKKRLVIDYQPLNMFLQDDKFPLPRRQSMFTFLKNAQIFSKFDLKSGFWQLGIEPSERYKTAFCIPNAHFQWTVLPFGLKTAPSIFQKSMVQIFQPILHHALIYIDDILLFSGSHDEHRQLLTQFYDILQSHGIMLSAKKSIIATDNVEFLGMIIKDGHYQPGKHIAQELLHFPDQQLSKRQIQQFLGIINYIRDFIPHVDHYTHHLSALLKKKPPEWNADHTFAVTTLKQIAQNPPPLKLITDGKRILQTDASDESWGAILLEEINGKENFIAYASGHFSDTQKHYHSVFKEILAVKNGIKKFEYHLIGHHFLIRMDSSSFPNIFHFKGKTVPEKMLLRLKDWFSKYDFSVKHIKGSQNLIPDMLSRLSKLENPLTLFSTTYHFPIISMATSLPPEALTKKTFPFNKTFSSVFAIQEFARKALFRFFMKAYLVTDPFPFSTFHPENLFLTGLTLDPTRETTEDVLWYIWCLTVLYATKLILPISPTLEHLLNPDNATSLTWTLLEWFSPIPWWRRKLQQLSEIYNLDRMPALEAPLFTSVFIIHRPYFQHPDTKLFWTQDQVYEWFTAPHIAVIENDIQDVLHNYLCQLNHQPPPLKDISHTSLGPQHDLLMIPTPSAISKPKSTGIIIKEEKPDYTDFLFQDSQDPWDAFLPLSQHLHQFPQPTMDEPGPSAPGPSTQSSKRPAQPSKVDKATQTSPKYTPKCTPRDYNCPYPPCRGPSCKHPKLSKIFFPKGNPDNPDETESSSEDEGISAGNPSLRTTGPKNSFNCCSSGITTPRTPKKDNGLMDQYHYHIVQNSSSDSSELETVYELNPSESNLSFSSSSTNSVGTSTDSESEYADITSILMATKTEYPSTSTATPIVDDSSSDTEKKASPTEPGPSMPPPVPDHSTKPSSASWFTFDDIPRHKWSARLQEFAAWIDLQGTSQMLNLKLFSVNSWTDQRVLYVIESCDSDDISVISTVQTVNHVSTIPRLSLKMSILPSKFHKLVPVIGFIDTGADTSMIDPSVLPSDCWEKHLKLFRAVNGETFETTLITKKPIGTWHHAFRKEKQHIAIELLKFSDTHLNRKQIQQFLGIVNYVRDFIPKVTIHTSQQSRMLKKQWPPWGPAQTEAVKQLKTDASDDYWSAILLEDNNGVRHFCAHASGQFKDSEKNYHVIYKEILAVKYGIKKFEFHLISHKFLINMDNSSFPRIFDFKNKLLPDKQLLSLKIWFAKYDFTVQHIKGNQNLIPDFLTRPAINKPSLISSIQTIPVIAMNRQLPFKALTHKNFPMNISFQLAYQLQDFAKKFLYRFFFNVQTKKPDRFLNLCIEHLFLTGLTLSSLSISEDELWYMWCLTTLYATKLVFPIRPVLTHLTTPKFSPDLLWTLFEWPYFQHPETRDYWTQDMAYEWRTYPHPYTLIHDTSVSSVLKAYLMELNNVPPPAINIHHTSIGPSHTLEVIPKTQGCTPGSSSSPQGILVMEQRPDYTNVLFQDAQDPWEDFQSLLHTENPHYTVTTPDSPTASTSQPMTEPDEDKYQQAEAYLDQRQIRRHKRQYEKDTRDVSPSRYPSTP